MEKKKEKVLVGWNMVGILKEQGRLEISSSIPTCGDIKELIKARRQRGDTMLVIQGREIKTPIFAEVSEEG